jgi:hypothetical protein
MLSSRISVRALGARNWRNVTMNRKDYGNRMGGCGLDSAGSGYDQWLAFFGHDN